MTDHHAYYQGAHAAQGYAGHPMAGDARPAMGPYDAGYGYYPVQGPAQGPAQGWYAQQGYYPPQGAQPYGQQQHRATGLTNERFLKGLLIGAAAAYLLTTEGVQRAAIKGAVKVWSTVQGGVEEVKERFKDAEAELRAAEASQEE